MSAKFDAKAQENYWAARWFNVAQIGNLPCRGLAIRRAFETRNSSRQPVGDTADWQSALLGLRLRRAESIRGKKIRWHFSSVGKIRALFQ
jgi:hypothetical protein